MYHARMDTTTITGGRLLKIARVARGLDQGQAAAMLGISQPYYSRLECDEKRPGEGLQQRIAEIFRIDTGAFGNGGRAA